MHLHTNWTPMYAEAVASWGAHITPPGPAVFVLKAIVGVDPDDR